MLSAEVIGRRRRTCTSGNGIKRILGEVCRLLCWIQGARTEKYNVSGCRVFISGRVGLDRNQAVSKGRKNQSLHEKDEICKVVGDDGEGNL
jgi:hypothetical protein